MIVRFLIRAVLLCVWAFPVVAMAQSSDAGRENALRVFLDCNTRNCDSDYFRTEVAFVNWVRDRTLAQVHLIITSTSTGGGGEQYTLDFIGLEGLEGSGDELIYNANTTNTQDETLSGLSKAIAVGLARFSLLIGQHGLFDISSNVAIAAETPASRVQDPTATLVSEEEVDDPWNFWVFEVGTEFAMSGEDTRESIDYGFSFDAQRTTDTWKFEFEAEADFSRDERQRSNGSVSIDERESWDTDLLLAYTLAEHWSLGVLSGVGSESRRNEALAGTLFGALEYNFFPYEEAPRRSFTARYDLGGRYFDWEEETIFNETSETRPQHQFRLQYFQRQPWGSATISFDAEQYLHDTQLWNASLNTNLSFRVTRGLNLNIRGEYALIEDQLFISREGLTDEEILLGSYERPTDSEYSNRIGISYEFGSIYNNVVNNRFDTGGGFSR